MPGKVKLSRRLRCEGLHLRAASRAEPGADAEVGWQVADHHEGRSARGGPCRLHGRRRHRAATEPFWFNRERARKGAPGK
jgi:hypothetical protein